MKPLSQSLENLATRVKVLEDSATATFEADRALIQNVSRDYFQTTKPPGMPNEEEPQQQQPPQSFDPTGQ